MRNGSKSIPSRLERSGNRIEGCGLTIIRGQPAPLDTRSTPLLVRLGMYPALLGMLALKLTPKLKYTRVIAPLDHLGLTMKGLSGQIVPGAKSF